MNKILPIILVVVLFGCTAGKHSIINNEVNNLEQLKNIYFSNTESLDPIEGIWHYGDTKHVIVKNIDNKYEGEDYLGFLFEPGRYLSGKTIYKIRKSVNNTNIFVGTMFYSFSALPPYDMEYTSGTFVIDANGVLVITPNVTRVGTHTGKPHILVKTYPNE